MSRPALATNVITNKNSIYSKLKLEYNKHDYNQFTLIANNFHFHGNFNKPIQEMQLQWIWLVQIYGYSEQFFIPHKSKSCYNYNNYNELPRTNYLIEVKINLWICQHVTCFFLYSVHITFNYEIIIYNKQLSINQIVLI